MAGVDGVQTIAVKRMLMALGNCNMSGEVWARRGAITCRDDPHDPFAGGQVRSSKRVLSPEHRWKGGRVPGHSLLV